MADRDYYEVLGVPRTATADQIKKAYRQLARKNHPDLNPDDKKAAEARFKEAQQAYDILSDPERRPLYDRFGHAAVGGASGQAAAAAADWAARQAGRAGGGFGPGPGRGPGAGPGPGPGNFENFDFSQFFGTGQPGGPGPGPAQGPGDEPGFDAGGIGGLFEELLGRARGNAGQGAGGSRRRGHDTEATLTVPFLTALHGGEVEVGIQRESGPRESLTVKIPPGTLDGKKLRLRGKGEPGPGGSPAGSLIVTVHVDPHPDFRVEGRDLVVDLPITIGEAVLGAKVEVRTPDGPKSLTVPPGTSSGQKLRLRGKGLPAAGDHSAGDLLVVPRIVVPRTLDDESRRLIREFADRNPADPRR